MSETSFVEIRRKFDQFELILNKLDKKTEEYNLKIDDSSQTLESLKQEYQETAIKFENVRWKIKCAQFISECEINNFDTDKRMLELTLQRINDIKLKESRPQKLLAEKKERVRALIAKMESTEAEIKTLKSMKEERRKVLIELEQETVLFKKKNAASLRRLIRQRQEEEMITKTLETKLLTLKQ